jgi:hypothetical protein
VWLFRVSRVLGVISWHRLCHVPEHALDLPVAFRPAGAVEASVAVTVSRLAEYVEAIGHCSQRGMLTPYLSSG